MALLTVNPVKVAPKGWVSPAPRSLRYPDVMGSLWRWTTRAELPADPWHKHRVSSSQGRELQSSFFPALCTLCTPKTKPLRAAGAPSLSQGLYSINICLSSHLEGVNVLQGTWAPTCLLQNTLSMAVYGASVAQLPHHHLPPTSWRAGEIPGAPELEVGARADGMVWVSGIGLDSHQEMEHPKAEITAKLCLCCSQRESGKAASPAPKFPWLQQEEKGWDPQIELSGAVALSYCSVWAGFAS